MASDLVTFAIGTFVAIFAIVNPIGATTFFVALTKGYTKKLRRRVVDKAVLAATLVSVLMTMAITFAMLTYSDRIFKRIGRMGASALSRIMGLILAAIAVQFVILGIQGAIALYFAP